MTLNLLLDCDLPLRAIGDALILLFLTSSKVMIVLKKIKHGLCLVLSSSWKYSINFLQVWLSWSWFLGFNSWNSFCIETLLAPMFWKTIYSVAKVKEFSQTLFGFILIGSCC